MLLNFVSIWLEPLSYLLFFFATVTRFKKERKGWMLVLVIFYLLASVSLGYAGWLVLQDKNNNWIYNGLYLPTLAAISYYFYKTLFRRANKGVVMFLVFVNVLYFFARTYPHGKFFVFDSGGYSLLSVSVSILSFMYFFQLLRNVNELNLLTSFDFWMVASFLLYFLGSFVIFALFSNLMNDIMDTYTSEQRRWLTVLWGVHNVLLFISSIIMLSSSLWTPYRTRS